MVADGVQGVNFPYNKSFRLKADLLLGLGLGKFKVNHIELNLAGLGSPCQWVFREDCEAGLVA